MKNKLDDLNKSLELFNHQEHAEVLDSIYRKIPEGTCSGCGGCCAESVHLFYSEFIRIIKYLKENGGLENTLERVEEFYNNEWLKPQGCVFLKEDKTCEIYSVRPLVCRLFGHKSKAKHYKDYKKILKKNKSIDKEFYKAYGVHVSKAVIKHRIKYCKDFKTLSSMDEESIKMLMDHMYGIEMDYLQEELIQEDAYEKSLTQWFVDYYLSKVCTTEKKVKGLRQAIES